MTNNGFPSIPGYKIEKKLGQGGMATVYLAFQESLGQHVALKVMSETLGEDAIWIRRFIKEAQIVAQLSHPNIIPVFDVGTHEGHFFISMETINGGDLEDKMRSGMSVSEILKVIVGVAAGLDFAGEKGFVHRDIKPDNVMFREDGSPVILDFGIVKRKDDSDNKMTKTGTIIGTAAYMSPEQVQGEELDERSDIYSLGCMMFELLSCQPPFQGDSAMAVLLKHMQEPVPALPTEFQTLQPVIDKAMAKSADQRYSRAREMIEHLQKLTPELSNLLAQQQTQEQLGDDGATKITDPDTKLATQVTGPSSSRSGTQPTAKNSSPGESGNAVSAEFEIADVLKDAKATIHDFSEATRSKKARRARGIIALASLVAMLAVGYVAYQQYYLVPLEMARAEQAAAEKSQKKVTALLEKANIASIGLEYSDLQAVDQLVVVYREILKIDPENSSALSALNKIGAQYIARANQQMADNNLDMAVIYRDYAEQLSPGHKELATLRAAITSALTDSARTRMERQFQQQQIDRLLAEVATEMASGQSYSDITYNKIQQVLELDGDNQQAKQQHASLVIALFDATKVDIEKERLDKARKKIRQLEKYGYSQDKIKDVRNALNIASTRLASRQQSARLNQEKKAWLVKARRLQREKRTISVNDELRDIYLAVLKIDNKNTEAINGLKNTSDYDADVTRTAINERSYSRAQQQINLIQERTPDYAELATLQRELTLAQQTSEDADKKLAGARQLLVSDRQGEARREELQKIYATLESVKQTDKNNPQLAPLLTTLESTYMSTIQQLIASKEQDLVTAYFKDIAGKNWPSDRLFQLQVAHQNIAPEKNKARRVFTGGF